MAAGLPDRLALEECQVVSVPGVVLPSQNPRAGYGRPSPGVFDGPPGAGTGVARPGGLAEEARTSGTLRPHLNRCTGFGAVFLSLRRSGFLANRVLSPRNRLCERTHFAGSALYEFMSFLRPFSRRTCSCALCTCGRLSSSCTARARHVVCRGAPDGPGRSRSWPIRRLGARSFKTSRPLSEVISAK